MHGAKHQHHHPRRRIKRRRVKALTLPIIIKKALPLQSPPGAGSAGRHSRRRDLTLDRALGHDRHPKTKENPQRIGARRSTGALAAGTAILLHRAPLPRRGWSGKKRTQAGTFARAIRASKAAGDVRGRAHPARRKRLGSETQVPFVRAAQPDRQKRARPGERLQAHPLRSNGVST